MRLSLLRKSAFSKAKRFLYYVDTFVFQVETVGGTSLKVFSVLDNVRPLKHLTHTLLQTVMLQLQECLLQIDTTLLPFVALLGTSKAACIF